MFKVDDLDESRAPLLDHLIELRTRIIRALLALAVGFGVCLYFADDKALFAGDTLFALGCGRMFEGTPVQFWTSLSKLKGLPADTRIYCGHEYTMGNLKFALSIDGNESAPGRTGAQFNRCALRKRKHQGEACGCGAPKTTGLLARLRESAVLMCGDCVRA